MTFRNMEIPKELSPLNHKQNWVCELTAAFGAHRRITRMLSLEEFEASSDEPGPKDQQKIQNKVTATNTEL